MEQNLPIIAKKFWNIVRVIYLMLRKGMSKGKLLSDLTMLMKRGKIAGKNAIHNLIFHSRTGRHLSFPVPPHEYEFSCSNTPAHPTFQFPTFRLNKRSYKYSSHITDEVLMAAAIQMINSASASPALPGFGPSPLVRQLRITDSPFPLRNADVDSYVDEAAEEFIMKFYKDLKRQNERI